MTTTHENFPRAGFIRRLAAMVYDSLIAIAVGMCAGLVIIVILVILLHTGILDMQGFEHSSEVMLQSIWYQIVIQLWVVAWVIGFFLWFWKNGGQTLGMRAWRLRIFSTDDKPMGYARACLRLFASLAGLGTLLVLLDWKHKQSLQDRIAHTQVLHLSMQANDHKNW